MDKRQFWQAVYIAAVQNGLLSEAAERKANVAVAAYEARWEPKTKETE